MFSSLRIPISPIFCSFNLRLKNDFYGYRVNSDKLAKELGNYDSSYMQNKAGKLTIAMRNKLLNSEASFNLETTLSGKGIVRFIKLAKKQRLIKF